MDTTLRSTETFDVPTHAFYYLEPTSDGRLLSDIGAEFDQIKYSKFKHGHGAIALDYGVLLAKSVVLAHPEIFSRDAKIAVAAAPYRSVPKGAQGIADAFLAFLNSEVLPSDNQAVKIKITAVNPPTDSDYSSLSEAERKVRNARVQFCINEDDFKDRFIFVIDDTRITGGTETKILRLFNSLGLPLDKVMMLYIACLNPEKAKVDPTIEDRMNTAYVKTLKQQAEVIASGSFLLNPRVIQFILNPKNLEDLELFAEKIDLKILQLILSGIVADDYHTKTNYTASYEILERVCRQRLGQ